MKKSRKKPVKMRPANFIWGYKPDLAEINRQNYQLILREYFRLTTKKITLLAMILALNVVMTIFSKFVLGLMPIMGFFVVELSFFTVLIFLMMSNLVYSILFLEVTIWFRVLLGDEPVGLIAMNLMDGAFLILFALCIFCFKFWAVRWQVKNLFKKLFYFELLIILPLILLDSGFAVFMNWLFILRIYGVQPGEILGYLPIIFAFNILKYVLNIIIYFAVYKTLIILIKRFQI